MWGVGVSAVLVADRRVDGLASFTLEPGWNAVDMDLGKKMRWSVDGGAIGGGLSSDAPRLLGKGEGCRPGGAVGVPWGCHEAAADPLGCEPSPGKVESTRRARSIRSCGAFSSTSPAPFGISRDGIARGDDRAPFIGCYQGSVEGIGWMRGWNGAHLDRQRVAKSGDWEVASAIIVQHQAASPSSGSAPPLVVAARVGNAVPYSNESGV